MRRNTVLVTLGILAAMAGRPATAQLGLGGSCFASAAIDKPRYLGRQAGNDSVEVVWRVPGTGQGTGGFQGGLGGSTLVGNPALLCAARAGFNASFQIALEIERRLNHTDSANSQASGPLAGTFQRNVQIPRAALETDPVSYEVGLTGAVQGFFTVTARATGNGAPSMAGATLSTGASNPAVTAECLPPMAITGLGLGPAGDTVNVSVNQGVPSAMCLRGSGTSVQVKLVRTDGTSLVRAAAVPPGAGSVQVALGQPAGQVASFEVTASVGLASTISLNGSAQGNF